MEKHYDLKNILAVHDNDLAFVKKMAKLFVELLPPLSKELLVATENKDFGKMYFTAHKLKASIDLFNVTLLQQKIRTLEDNGKNKLYSEQLKKDAELIDKIINTCVLELNEDLQLSIFH